MQAGGTAGLGRRKDEKGGQARDQLTTRRSKARRQRPRRRAHLTWAWLRALQTAVLRELCRLPGSVALLRCPKLRLQRPGGPLPPCHRQQGFCMGSSHSHLGLQRGNQAGRARGAGIGPWLHLCPRGRAASPAVPVPQEQIPLPSPPAFLGAQPPSRGTHIPGPKGGPRRRPARSAHSPLVR